MGKNPRIYDVSGAIRAYLNGARRESGLEHNVSGFHATFLSIDPLNETKPQLG